MTLKCTKNADAPSNSPSFPISTPQHLVPYLPQLYDFFATVGDKLEPDELMSVSEAVGHVVAGMAVSDAIEPLMRFTQPILERLHAIASMPAASVTKKELRTAADRMEQLEKFLHVVGSQFSEGLPPTCSQTCQEAYAILDSILAQHHATFFVSERTCALLRRSLSFFGNLAIPTLPTLLERLVSSFENTGFPGYIWIVGKVLDGFGNLQDEQLMAGMSSAFQRTSSKVLGMMESTSPQELSDGESSTYIVLDRSDEYVLTFLPLSLCSSRRLPSHLRGGGQPSPSSFLPLPSSSSRFPMRSNGTYTLPAWSQRYLTGGDPGGRWAFVSSICRSLERSWRSQSSRKTALLQRHSPSPQLIWTRLDISSPQRSGHSLLFRQSASSHHRFAMSLSSSTFSADFCLVKYRCPKPTGLKCSEQRQGYLFGKHRERNSRRKQR